MLLNDREEAGIRLAALLGQLKGGDALLLAIPRGGVVVAYHMARELGLMASVLGVRKLGAPFNPELALGAVAEDGSYYVDEQLASGFGISNEYLQARIRELAEQARSLALKLRRGAPLPQLGGRTVVLVDDGVATGATVRAAIRLARKGAPSRLLLAVPVLPKEVLGILREEADDVIYLYTPEPFFAVGEFYRSFPPVSDEEAIQLLSELHRQPRPP
ncbi:MAG: phosphoribosyltransferase [Nitrososphaerota archaeon]